MGASRRSVGHALRVLLVGLAVAACGLLAVPAPAQASSSSDFVARINAERASRGVPTLVVRGDLAAAAQAQAERMADASSMFHNPNLGGSVSHWTILAENVGYGPDVARIHGAFMASAPHKANILNRKYTEVGVGVVVRDHVMWVAEVFRLPSGSTGSASPGKHSSGSGHAPKKGAAAKGASHAATSKASQASQASRASKATSSSGSASSASPARHAAHGAPARAGVAPRPSLRVLRWAEGADQALPAAAVLAAAPVALDAAAGLEPADPLPTTVFIGLGVLALVLVGAATRIRLG